MSDQLLWWQRGIVYQIYPRSFQDSNGDGLGDLPGIEQRLDYVAALGVDAIWMSPIFPSPMADAGYDVADYCDIEPLFGTLADFDRLLAATHARGLKLILDLVPNHTSDQHSWFLDSRSRRTSAKRNWYIWRNPAPDGGPPNNWGSFFGGPAWTLDATTGQYYLHQFASAQPELNYRNPAVLAAMLDAMRFWLDRGVDGFRVDVIWLLMKDPDLRDEPLDPNWDGTGPHFNALQHIYTQNLPETHGVIRTMRALLDEYDERVMIGEIYLKDAELMAYYGAHGDECHLPFNFQLVMLNEWRAAPVKALVDRYEALLPAGAWPNWVMGNHDQHRVATRVGAAQARIVNMLLLTLRGTPTSYYGEELGMTDGHIPADKVQDPQALNQPELADTWGRDPERTPMQWDVSPNAGFTAADVEPWLPVASTAATVNVAAQQRNPTSMLALYRALTTLRRAEPALHGGEYVALDAGHDEVFAYVRRAAGRSFLVALNFGAQSVQLDLSAAGATGRIVVATGLQRADQLNLDTVALAGNEGRVIAVD